jgi:hypothetical protein
MNKAVLFSMTDAERLLVAETEKKELHTLDEEALLALETRIRRARNKYVGLYRRQAATQVQKSGGRGKAGPKNQRNRDKAEVFELALARVSRRVAAVAKQASDDLRAERLEAARKGSSKPATKSGAKRKTSDTGRTVPHAKLTGGIKKDASSKAQGAKRQAKRDSR